MKAGCQETISFSVVKVLGEFYCPARCAGTEPPVLHPNCLTDYKTKFNLGPPGRAAHPGKESIFQKSCQPISKHTSYTLDYKPHATKPR
ncbi:hypothetical protein CDAR_86811 [Caerostris darwini]|uniref:Uncharacterized protein n=1 Tax=Caerostris darwini TaxID=1538125 RepID=A0AAV4VN68_9ARAC|nr:hypothetical protein CDAR_86811 [Caerostris darwini]